VVLAARIGHWSDSDRRETGQSQRTKEGLGKPKIVDRVALRQDEKTNHARVKPQDKISRLLQRDPNMGWGDIVRLSRAPTEEVRKAMAEMQARPP